MLVLWGLLLKCLWNLPKKTYRKKRNGPLFHVSCSDFELEKACLQYCQHCTVVWSWSQLQTFNWWAFLGPHPPCLQLESWMDWHHDEEHKFSWFLSGLIFILAMRFHQQMNVFTTENVPHTLDQFMLGPEFCDRMPMRAHNCADMCSNRFHGCLALLRTVLRGDINNTGMNFHHPTINKLRNTTNPFHTHHHYCFLLWVFHPVILDNILLPLMFSKIDDSSSA